MAMESPKNEQYDTDENAVDLVRPTLDPYTRPEYEVHT